MLGKLVSATMTVIATFGMVGVLSTAQVSAAGEVCNDANTSNKNNECYWEKQLGAECTKYDNINKKEFTVPAAPAGNTYVEAIVKAGSGEGENEQKGAVKAGDVLKRTDGKDISHVILCYKPAGGSGGGSTPTPTPTPTPVGGSGTTAPTTSTPAPAASAPVVSGQGTAVASLPITSGSGSQLITLAVFIGSALAGAATYAIRTRTGFSL